MVIRTNGGGRRAAKLMLTYAGDPNCDDARFVGASTACPALAHFAENGVRARAGVEVLREAVTWSRDKQRPRFVHARAEDPT